MLKDEKYTPRYNDKYLQHYTTADGLIGILKSMKLNFSQYKKSNDIKERRLEEHDEVRGMKRKDRKEYAGRHKWISFFVRDDSRIVRQPKMFDLYAGYHKGACIEFEKEKLMQKNIDLHLNFKSVKYDSFFLKQKETIKEELEYKYYQWKEENEQRIIYTGCMVV
jgi:hypothetical protein